MTTADAPGRAGRPGTALSKKPIVVAALFRTLAGMSFAPNAFDKAKSMKQVLKIVKGTGFLG